MKSQHMMLSTSTSGQGVHVYGTDVIFCIYNTTSREVMFNILYKIMDVIE